MIVLRKAWNWLADCMGFVKKSAMLSAVRTKGTSSSKDSTLLYTSYNRFMAYKDLPKVPIPVACLNRLSNPDGLVCTDVAQMERNIYYKYMF